MLSVESDFTFQADETYVALGDGSETSAGVFYGFVLVPELQLDDCRRLIRSVKERYGDVSAQLHCRELYAKHARGKSRWSHLTEETAIELCGDVLRGLAGLDLKFMMMHIPKEHFPLRFRLKGKYGHPDLVHAVNAKWMMLWGFMRLAGLLDPKEVIPPVDPVEHPRERNLPFWDLVNRRSWPGPAVRRVIIDQETTKIRWVSKSFMWTTVARHVRVDGPKGLSMLPIEISSRAQEPLLELADIFVYSVARAFSGGRPLEYRDFQAEVSMEVFGQPCEELVLGLAPTGVQDPVVSSRR